MVRSAATPRVSNHEAAPSRTKLRSASTTRPETFWRARLGSITRSMRQRSRDTVARAIQSRPLSNHGGRREDRAPAGTHGPRATKKHAAEPQVQPKSPGLPCAMVLRLIRGLPGETGLFCHRHRRDAKHHRQIGTCIGAPGPHDFAVRKRRARQSQRPRPPHLTATFVTIAIRPSSAVRRAKLDT
jgi:hypothetical protein